MKELNRKERALQYFADKFYCSQALPAAFSDKCGITEEQALKLGACLGAGMRRGEVCGACTGALLVLGLLYGHCHKGNLEERQRADKYNGLMMDRFKEKNGSYICNDLLGCDISTPEGAQCARDKGLFVDLCPKMVASAVEILVVIIAVE